MQVHQSTHAFIDHCFDNLDTPLPIPSHDARNHPLPHVRSSSVNMQQAALPVPLQISLSPVESMAPSVQMDLAAPSQVQSDSLEITRVEQQIQQIKQPSPITVHSDESQAQMAVQTHSARPLTVPSNRIRDPSLARTD